MKQLNNLTTRQIGQSLLEVTIAIGIAVVVLSTLTFITLTGYKNSQVSQNQLTATKLAQDTMEQIRAMKDQKKAVCYSSTIYSWSTLFANAGNCVSGCDFIIQTGPPFCSVPGSDQTAPYLNLSGTYQTVPGNSRFSRLVDIKNCTVTQGGSFTCDPSTVRVQVLIKWTDTGGTHTVNLVSNLGPN